MTNEAPQAPQFNSESYVADSAAAAVEQLSAMLDKELLAVVNPPAFVERHRFLLKFYCRLYRYRIIHTAGFEFEIWKGKTLVRTISWKTKVSR